MATTTTFTVSKSTVELYKIRLNGGYWADITIDAHGHTGRISIASDYGKWSNYWGACGSDFKTFLAEINEDYVADKFGVEDHVDVDTTAKRWRREVLKYRRQGHINDSQARDIWDEIEELTLYSEHTIESALMGSNYVVDFLREWSDDDWVHHKPNPQFAAFWKDMWPILLAEFAREAESATPTKEGGQS